MTIVINEIRKDSQVKISNDYKGGAESDAMASSMSGISYQSDWSPAICEIARSGIAFVETVNIARCIKVGHILYTNSLDEY